MPFHVADGWRGVTKGVTVTLSPQWREHQIDFDLFPADEVTAPKLLKNDLDDVPPLGVALTAGKRRFVESVLEHGLHRDAVRAYLATTAYADAQMGRVLDALENSPSRDNTSHDSHEWTNQIDNPEYAKTIKEMKANKTTDNGPANMITFANLLDR